MTTFNQAEINLLAEVRGRIESLVPLTESVKKFRHRTEREISDGSIEESTGRTRLYEIRPGEFVESFEMGADSRGLKYIYPILIQYEADSLGKWARVSRHDAECIRHDLIVNGTTATGTQQRHLDPAQPYVFGETDDGWIIVTCRLAVYYTVTTA